MKMITLKVHRFAEILRKPGDTYDAKNAGDIRLVKALGWAKEAPEVKQAPQAKPVPPVLTDEVELEKAAGTYQTRDMVAADESPRETVDMTADTGAGGATTAPAKKTTKRTYTRRAPGES